jgi:hypothetical protein
MMDSGVVAEITHSGATGCTQPVYRKRGLEHGLSTTRGTRLTLGHPECDTHTPDTMR